MTHKEIRERFVKFFESKGHKAVPSSSLLPTDPSVLFTTAGMQQFKPYYTDPAAAKEKYRSLNTVTIQKCLRTSDIDEVGDESHLTFFEMLGNFSFGGYWKEEAIKLAYEFITQELGLKIDHVSIFGGDSLTPADAESESIWKSVDPSLEIRKHNREDNFWGPTGAEGPCGPTTEIYVNGLEVWNIVFNEFYCTPEKEFKSLETKGIDTGMGLERLAMVVQNKKSIYETDLFEPLILLIPQNENISERIKRIIVDHTRAAAFLVCDGVQPSNKEQGYVLRRLIRRVIVHLHQGRVESRVIEEMFDQIRLNYGHFFPELDSTVMKEEFNKERIKFEKTLTAGLKELNRFDEIDAAAAFRLYESFGLPFEIIKETAGDKASGLTREDFEKERERHREISRAGVEKKFGGHGIVEGDLTAASKEEMWQKTRLHTATHLIVAALKKVLKQDLPQAGSDITVERLRFDFTFPRKVTDDELREAERLANEVVDQDLPVTWKEMELNEAIKSGASAFFKLKYPPKVKVYTIGPDEGWFSRELCGGPHVTSTKQIGHIKITKEESVSGGNRRIRAVIE